MGWEALEQWGDDVGWSALHVGHHDQTVGRLASRRRHIRWAALQHNAAGLDDATYDVAAQARAAWQAAVGWDPSGTDEFAAKQLADVRAV